MTHEPSEMTKPAAQSPHTVPLHAAQCPSHLQRPIMFVLKNSSPPHRNAPRWTAHGTHVPSSPTTPVVRSMHDEMLQPFPLRSLHDLQTPPSSNAFMSGHKTTPSFVTSSPPTTVVQAHSLFAVSEQIGHFISSHAAQLSSHSAHVRQETPCLFRVLQEVVVVDKGCVRVGLVTFDSDEDVIDARQGRCLVGAVLGVCAGRHIHQASRSSPWCTPRTTRGRSPCSPRSPRPGTFVRPRLPRRPRHRRRM